MRQIQIPSCSRTIMRVMFAIWVIYYKLDNLDQKKKYLIRSFFYSNNFFFNLDHPIYSEQFEFKEYDHEHEEIRIGLVNRKNERWENFTPR